MTIPDDLELDRALRRAVATIPVDVDAGWHDLGRRSRRRPGHIALWAAVAAIVLVAVLVPIRLLAGAESSLDVTGDPGIDQPAPAGTEVVPTLDPMAGPPRPIRVLLELTACADDGDLDVWAAATATTLDPAWAAAPFVTTTVADVLAVTPMPTDATASCAVTRRAGGVVAFETRDAAGSRLGRGVSVPYASDLVPLALRKDPYLGSAVGSGQPVSGTMARVDGTDLITTTYKGTGTDGRLIAIERPASSSDPDLNHAALVFLSSLTGAALDPLLSMAAIPASILPTSLPRGYRLCVPYAITELDAVAGLGPGGVVYCDDDGQEIRFLTGVDEGPASSGPFDGLPLPVEELVPSSPDRRTLGLGAGPGYDLIIDVPAELADADLLAMLRSVPAFDERVLRPHGGSNDYRQQAVLPLIDGALMRSGIGATTVPGDEATAGFASFTLPGDEGSVLSLRVFPSQVERNGAAPLLPLNEADVLAVRTVAGIDVMLLARPNGTSSAPAVHQALFRCGALDWNLTVLDDGRRTPIAPTDPGPTTLAPDPGPGIEQAAIDLVEGMVRELPC